MLSSIDFLILLLSMFLGTLLAIGLTMMVSFAVAGKKLNKFMTNELNSKTGTLIEMLGSHTGKQIWKQERASKAGAAKGEKSKSNSILVDILGPELAAGAQLLPANLRDPLIKLASENPQMVQAFLAQIQGAQPAPGTPVAGPYGQVKVPVNEFPPE